MMKWLVLVVAALCVGCVSTEIDLDQYDRTCEVDDDCVLAAGGSACACLSCDGAINRADETTYAADVNLAQEGCTSLALCAACPPARPVCTAGSCERELLE